MYLSALFANARWPGFARVKVILIIAKSHARASCDAAELRL
jgi:hypothetical protein